MGPCTVAAGYDIMTAAIRAHAVLAQAGLTGAGRPMRVANSLNEVWFVGPYVVRVNTRGDRLTLAHERDVLQALPRGVPAPLLVDYGECSFGEWLVVSRAPGEELSRFWPTMSEEQREEAITTLGHGMRELHHVNARALGLDRAPFLESGATECPHRLPVDRLLDLLAQVARFHFVDPALMRSAVEQLIEATAYLDPDSETLVHGDLHFENVLWDGTALTAIIDWEWSRPGPPDLDLDVLLHSLADPAAHVGLDYAAPRRRDFDNVVTWLRGAYPELFAHAHLAQRLFVYRLAYDAPDLLRHPPDRPTEKLPWHHPYLRIQRLVEGRSDLAWILAN